MRYVLLVVGLLFCCLRSSGVSAQVPKPAIEKTLAERVKALEQQVDWMQAWITDLGGLTGNRAVTLDCTGGTSIPIMPSSHTFELLAICGSVEPYLEGYRIKLRIGSQQAMEFYGLEGELGYGENLVKSLSQHVHFVTVENLTPGAWTTIQITINPAAAKDVRLLRLYGLTTKGTKGVVK